jgi:hypothetical protein
MRHITLLQYRDTVKQLKNLDNLSSEQRIMVRDALKLSFRAPSTAYTSLSENEVVKDSIAKLSKHVLASKDHFPPILVSIASLVIAASPLHQHGERIWSVFQDVARATEEKRK